jgi:hypothetical protein
MLTTGIGRNQTPGNLLVLYCRENKPKVDMLYYKNYVAGWLDSSISDFFATFSCNSKATAFALITCLDSDTRTRSLLRRRSDLQSGLVKVHPSMTGVIVPSTLTQEANRREQLFFGYDEVWFFSTKKIGLKPKTTSIVGPNRIDQARLDKLGPWMSDNGCSLALGDGDGLNFIVKAHGFIKYLLALSMSQPEPTFQLSEFVRDDTGEK